MIRAFVSLCIVATTTATNFKYTTVEDDKRARMHKTDTRHLADVIPLGPWLRQLLSMSAAETTIMAVTVM